MKRIVLLAIIFIFSALPCFAADADDDEVTASADFPGGSPEKLADAGPKTDPLIEIRNWLGRAGAPAMDKNQQKLLHQLYDNDVKAISKGFESKFGVSLPAALKALAAQSASTGRRRAAPAPRPNPEFTAEVRQISDHLNDRLIAALRLDQQLPLRKYQSELVRVRRIEQFKQKTAASGTILTAQQQSDIDAVFARESYLRTNAMIQAAGDNPDKLLNFVASQTEKRLAAVLGGQSQPRTLSAESAPSEIRPNVD